MNRRRRRNPFREAWRIGAEERVVFFTTVMVGLPIVVWILA